jgi:ABC-type multidrug transport system fused ATPase/permease subunit
VATLQDVVNLRPSVISGKKLFTSLKKWIICEHLTFAYSEDDVIRDLSLTIPAQKMTLIMGANGSWKSTLLSLILRFYDCPSGTIFIDGQDIHELEIPSWRSQIAYVAQDVILFNGTVRENMTYWYEKTISQKQLDEVIEKVGLTEFLATISEWIETNIGDGWLKFSGWQRQRIAIARALLCNPQIIIFDEATKSVDAATDDLIMRMLVNDFKYTTRIVVSHSGHHEKFADHIIVLENWSVVKKSA